MNAKNDASIQAVTESNGVPAGK